MRVAYVTACLAAAAALTLTPAYAGQHGHAPVTTPHATSSPHTTTTTTQHPTSTSHPTATSHPSKPSTTTKHGTSTTTSPTSTPTTASPIAAKIESHPQLASRLQAMLPSGMTLDQAASGFRNQGQFIAALHVSQNLGIPFDQLKTQMTTNHLSLGQSIQKLKPTANATTETKTAETEADNDVKPSSTTSTTTASTTKSKKHSPGR